MQLDVVLLVEVEVIPTQQRPHDLALPRLNSESKGKHGWDFVVVLLRKHLWAMLNLHYVYNRKI
jgi:hypothetical protein